MPAVCVGLNRQHGNSSAVAPPCCLVRSIASYRQANMLTQQWRELRAACCMYMYMGSELLYFYCMAAKNTTWAYQHMIWASHTCIAATAGVSCTVQLRHHICCWGNAASWIHSSPKTSPTASAAAGAAALAASHAQQQQQMRQAQSCMLVQLWCQLPSTQPCHLDRVLPAWLVPCWAMFDSSMCNVLAWYVCGGLCVLGGSGLVLFVLHANLHQISCTQ